MEFIDLIAEFVGSTPWYVCVLAASTILITHHLEQKRQYGVDDNPEDPSDPDDPGDGEETVSFYIHPFPHLYYGEMGVEGGELDYANDADAYEAAVGRQQLQISTISTP